MVKHQRHHPQFRKPVSPRPCKGLLPELLGSEWTPFLVVDHCLWHPFPSASRGLAPSLSFSLCLASEKGAGLPAGSWTHLPLPRGTALLC